MTTSIFYPFVMYLLENFIEKVQFVKFGVAENFDNIQIFALSLFF